MWVNQNTKRHLADWCHLQYCLSGDVFSLLNHSEKQLSLLNEKLEKLDGNQNWMWYSFWLRRNHFNALLIHIFYASRFNTLSTICLMAGVGHFVLIYSKAHLWHTQWAAANECVISCGKIHPARTDTSCGIINIIICYYCLLLKDRKEIGYYLLRWPGHVSVQRNVIKDRPSVQLSGQFFQGNDG